MSKITGHEYPLLKIFSSDFEYHIPAYQRPYAWTVEETSTLFDDLYSFYTSEPEDENYFLGSIVLIKENTDRRADVIDGQQRLTTLTILFAVLAECLKDPENRSSCMEILQEKGHKFAGIASQPRLFLREWDQDFFNKYIQNVKIEDLLKIDSANLDTESKKHIQENCNVLKERFSETFTEDEDELLKFSSFLLNRCYLVTVSTPSQASAFRVFSVMNSRGGNASGYPLDDNFVVVAGSKISKDVTEGFQHGYLELRESLMEDGIISNGVFVKDYMFLSSSTAAAVVLGRAANGRKEWKLLD